MSVATAPIFEETILNDADTEKLSVPKVVWFPGDTIKPNEKHYTNAWKGFGGTFLPQFHTIQHDGNRLHWGDGTCPPQGMVYRCRFTQMRVKMRQEWSQMLPPADIRYWKSSYTIKNGNYDPVTKQFSDAVIRSPGQLYRPDIFPGREIHEIVQATPGNDIGGRVEITALEGADVPTITKAQYFFFPEWDEYVAMNQFPEWNIRQLEAHIKARVVAAESLDYVAKNLYTRIAADMIKGCQQYRMGGLRYLKAIEDNANVAKAKGVEYSFPDLAVMLLDQLEQKRKDDLVSGEASVTAELTREMREDRAERQKVEAQKLLLEERKQYTAEISAGLRARDEAEEIRLGIKKAPEVTTSGYIAVEPVVAPPSVLTTTPPADSVVEMSVPERLDPTPIYETPTFDETPSTEVEPPALVSQNTYDPPAEVTVCGHPTANGTCARTATDNGKCWQHK